MRKFFQSAAKCTDAGGNIQWKKVKGCLQEVLTTVECNRQTTAIRGKFHPLSVWEKKGYDVKEIEKKGEKKESDMPPGSSGFSSPKRLPINLRMSHFLLNIASLSADLRFGWVYKVSTLEVSLEHVSEEVRTKILKAERKIGKKGVLNAIG